MNKTIRDTLLALAASALSLAFTFLGELLTLVQAQPDAVADLDAGQHEFADLRFSAVPTSQVPEPAALALVLAGFAAAGVATKRRPSGFSVTKPA